MDAGQPQETVLRRFPQTELRHAAAPPDPPSQGTSDEGVATRYPSEAARTIELVEQDLRWVKGWRGLVVALPILPRTHPLATPLWRYSKKNWPRRVRFKAKLQETRVLLDLWALLGAYAILSTVQVNLHWPFVWEGLGLFLASSVIGLLDSLRWSSRARSNKPKAREWRRAQLELAERELQEHEPGRPY